MFIFLRHGQFTAETFDHVASAEYGNNARNIVIYWCKIMINFAIQSFSCANSITIRAEIYRVRHSLRDDRIFRPNRTKLSDPLTGTVTGGWSTGAWHYFFPLLSTRMDEDSAMRHLNYCSFWKECFQHSHFRGLQTVSLAVWRLIQKCVQCVKVKVKLKAKRRFKCSQTLRSSFFSLSRFWQSRFQFSH